MTTNPIKPQSPVAQTLCNRVSVHQRHMQRGDINPDHLRVALQSAMSAPDHRGLQPYRYGIAVGDGASAFYQVLLDYYVAHDKPRDRVERIFAGVPAYISVFADIQGDEIPDYQQEWTTACATQNMLNVLYDYGYACKWNSLKKDTMTLGWTTKFGFPAQWVPMGFVMVGHTDAEHLSPKERPNPADYAYEYGTDGIGEKFFKG